MGRILSSIGGVFVFFGKIFPYVLLAYLLFLLMKGFNTSIKENKKGFDFWLFACEKSIENFGIHLVLVFKMIMRLIMKFGNSQNLNKESGRPIVRPGNVIDADFKEVDKK